MKSNNRTRKQIISISLVWLLFFSVFLVYPLPIEQQVRGSFTGEDATPPVNGDWVIDSPGNIVINETIILNGDLTILNGGSLTFKNVTLLMNCNWNGTYNIKVDPGGEFYIFDYDNNSLTTEDSSIVTSATADCRHRFYFLVQSNTKFEMKNSELHECGYEMEGSPEWSRGLYIGTNNVIIENCVITYNYIGLILWNSNDALILNTSISHNMYRGIYISDALNITIKNCIVASNEEYGGVNDGILILFSINISFFNCSIYQHLDSGISIGFATGINVSYCNILNNGYGISVSGGCSSINLMNNTIAGNLEYAIYNYGNTNLNAQYNYFGTNNRDQIKNFITGNTNYSNWLTYRYSNILHINNTKTWENCIEYLNNGLIIKGNLSIKNCTLIFNNSLGKNFIQVSGNLYLENSTIKINQTKLELISKWGVYSFIYLYNSSGNIDYSNIQDPKGICIRNKFMKISYTNISSPDCDESEYGLIIWGNYANINCCNIKNFDFGIEIHSSNNIINNCNISLNTFGISIKGEKNKIINCRIFLNLGLGFWLKGNFNNISKSNVSYNGEGFFINGGMNNTITNCNITFNQYFGVNIFSKVSLPYNKIYHNNFIHNSLVNSSLPQAQDYCLFNEWDNGYPNGGNYWSDYVGSDRFHGEKQNLTGSDGVGDWPYYIQGPGSAKDRYPLMEINGQSSLIQIPILNKLSSPDIDGIYNISWSSAANATMYTLEESINEDFSWITNKYYSNQTYYKINGQDNGTYYYRVRGSNNKYVGDWSNIVSIIVDWPPDIPTNITVTQIREGNALNISWKLNQIDTINYSLWSNKTGNWQFLINITHSNNTYNDTNLIDGVIYYYKLKAWDGIGQQSGFSGIVSNTSGDSMSPVIPTDLKAITISNNSINLSWEPNLEPDLIGYDIYRSENQSTGYIKINSNPVDKNIYIDINLSENTTYYYKIKAFDEVPNYSIFSKEASNTTFMIPPYIISFSPVGNMVPMDANITITFSRSMNITSVESAFSITPVVEGKFSWTENNHALIFDPFEDLKEQETYNVTISNSAVDLRNNSLDHPFSWEFVTLNIISPKIVSYFPKGTHIPIDIDISVTFNVEMNKTSVETAFSIIPDTEGIFHWSKDNMTLIFDPEMNLFKLTVYEISINIPAVDLSGNSIGSIFNWNFTTGNFTSPGIILYSPIGNNIPVGTNISITFNIAMNKTSVIESFSITNNVEGEFYWSGNTLIFEPSANLEYDSKYTVTITIIAQDNWGNHIKANFTWEFTTEKKEDQEASQDKIDAESIYIGIFLIILIIIIIVSLIWIKVKSFKANNKVEEKEAADNEMEE